MGTGSSFPGVKRPGREADHSPPSSAEVKKMWTDTVCTSLSDDPQTPACDGMVPGMCPLPGFPEEVIKVGSSGKN
jgi:hypothetical protein